jgi:hypothetical protein
MMMFVNDNILPIDGEVFLFDTFFGKDESDLFFNNLKNTIDWKQEGMKMYGKEILFPRLTAWYGDENAKYKYSGIVNIPLPWTEELLFIKQIISATATKTLELNLIYQQFLIIGFYSLPIVGFTAIFSGAVLALQSYVGFSRFAAEASIPNVIVLSITRELGPVLAGLMVAGRTGSSIAAEI